jgi:WD40 repeat protein
MKKAALGFLAALLLFPLVFISRGETKTQPYYSGDAFNYQGEVVFGTTNTGYLEIYKLDGQIINRVIKIKNYNPTFNNYEDFSDLKFSLEGGQLYVYTISQYTVFKYNFSDLNTLKLVAKEKNTYWEWYKRIDRFGDNLGLVSDKGIKIIKPDLQVINAYDFSPSEDYSIRHSDNQKIFGINDGKIQIYDRESRAIFREIALNFNSDNPYHKIYYNSATQEIYAVDDYYAKKFSLDGRLLASYRHLDAAGYDMESSAGNAYVYFSNGFGVVKMDQSDFQETDYVYTTSLGGPQGWAMGLKLVNTDDGDRLIVFNASNILVLDANLNKIASVKAEEDAPLEAKESLFLRLNHNLGTPGAIVNVTGGGFFPNEQLSLSFGGQKFTANAGNNGRFDTNVTVPNLKAQRLDIKVDGLDSGFTYSISFEIK